MATVTVESQPDRAFAVTFTGEEHAFIADEPATYGGDDLGPTPYELLLAALGSCTAMTVGSYARRQGWPLERVIIRLTHDRVHADDCEGCEDPTSRIDRITREIGLTGALDDEQSARLTEIAAKCPVHRTLLSQPRIVDRVLEPAADR